MKELADYLTKPVLLFSWSKNYLFYNLISIRFLFQSENQNFNVKKRKRIPKTQKIMQIKKRGKEGDQIRYQMIMHQVFNGKENDYNQQKTWSHFSGSPMTGTHTTPPMLQGYLKHKTSAVTVHNSFLGLDKKEFNIDMQYFIICKRGKKNYLKKRPILKKRAQVKFYFCVLSRKLSPAKHTHRKANLYKVFSTQVLALDIDPIHLILTQIIYWLHKNYTACKIKWYPKNYWCKKCKSSSKFIKMRGREEENGWQYNI